MTAAFPADLLTRPCEERLEYFRAYTVAHPLLVEAKDRLMAAISESEPNSLVFVFGPTGVGKTTLRIKLSRSLLMSLGLVSNRTEGGFQSLASRPLRRSRADSPGRTTLDGFCSP
jgi:putative ribosome biogenesis GTPase RsgA